MLGCKHASKKIGVVYSVGVVSIAHNGEMLGRATHLTVHRLAVDDTELYFIVFFLAFLGFAFAGKEI